MNDDFLTIYLKGVEDGKDMKKQEIDMLERKLYDLQQENKQLKEKIENLTTMTVCGDRKQIKNTAQYKLELAQRENKKEKGRVNVLEDKLREILHFCNHLHNDCKYNLNDGYIRKIRNICKKVLNEETEVKENE